MTANSKLSTADTDHRQFRAHGLVEVEIRGNIARYEAWGPFNEELVVAYTAIQARVIPEMVAMGRWGDLSVFHISAMASPKTFEAFASDLKACALQGLAPYATALVMAPEVEGATLMGPLFARCYLDAGLTCKVFSQLDMAEAWLQSVLNDTTAQSGPR